MSGSWSGNVYTGDGADEVIVGTAADEIVTGGAGNDTITGGGGFDDINAGVGDDSVSLLLSTSALLSSFANGGPGIDYLTVSFTGSLSAGVRMTGSLGTGRIRDATTGTVLATIRNFEAITMTTGSGDDNVFGAGGNDLFSLSTGANVANTGLGDDQAFLSLDAGFDMIDLGGGTDTLSLFGATAVRVELDPVFTMLFLGGVHVGDVTGAERLFVNGSNGDDVIAGGAFDDVINVNTGANTVRGGGGSDRISFSVDGLFDAFFGGGGVDDLVASASTAYSSSLKANGVLVFRQGGQVVAKASNFEGALLQGADSGLANDKIGGTNGNDSIFGRGGNDTLSGNDGNDSFYGGDGDDDFFGGAGADSFIFLQPQEGIDRIHDLKADDVIGLFGAAFGLAPGQPVFLNTGVDPQPVPGSIAPVFLFDTTTGILRFDADGAGAGAPLRVSSVFDGGAPADLEVDQLVVF